MAATFLAIFALTFTPLDFQNGSSVFFLHNTLVWISIATRKHFWRQKFGDREVDLAIENLKTLF